MKPDYEPIETDYSDYEPLAKTGADNRHISVPNYLSATNFRVVIPRLPKLSYYIQTVTVPSLSINSIDIGFKGFPRTSVPSSVDISDQVIITFGIDERMENWQDIYDWMTSITPNSTNNGGVGAKDPYSEIIVLLYNAQRKLQKKLTYESCHPISLGSFDMNSTSNTIDPIVVTTNFAYKKLSIESY